MNPKPDSSFMSAMGTWLVDRVNIFFRIRRYLKMVAQRWIVLAVCTILATSYAAYLAVRSPDIYSAYSKIGIAPKILTPNLPQAQYLEELNSFYERNLGYLNSSKVRSRVDKRMRENPSLAPPAFFGPSAIKGPGSFTLVVESTDFEYARAYAQAWAREFVNFKNELRMGAFGTKAESTREDIRTWEKKLETARNALQEFKKKHNIGSVKETGIAAQERLFKLEAEYQDKKTLRQRLENKTAEEIIIGPPGDLSRNPADRPPVSTQKPPGTDATDPMAKFDSAQYGELKFRLRNKEAELARQSKILRPGHSFMKQLNEEIAQIKQQLQFILDLIEEKRLAQIKSLKDDERSYEPIIQSLKTEVLASSNLQNDFERLQEEETNIKHYLENLRQTELSLNATTTTGDDGELNILEEGVGSPRPIKPNRPQMILAGLALGLGIGLALVYLLGRLDDRIELADDIEAGLGEAVLGQVPQVDTSKLKMETVLITRLEEHDIFAESIRHVRSAVMFGSHVGNKQVLLATSAIPGDGKTTITVNFAVTLAIAGHRVLLVDADMRRGNTHSYFGASREPGFSDVLLGQLHWSDVIQETEVKTLHVIYSGKLPSNPGELLISPIIGQFLQEAKKSFDYIIFDCPPLTGIDDTFALAGLVDGLIFVVRSGHTSLRFAQNALDAVRQRGAKILGVVLNGITADNPQYYYRNYYHAYYSKGQPRPATIASDIIPAVKMASPQNKSHRFRSIIAEAKGLAGEQVSDDQVADEEKAKTTQFRKKRTGFSNCPTQDSPSKT